MAQGNNEKMSADAARPGYHWSLDPYDWVAMLRAGARTIFLFVALALALGVAYLLLVPPRYTASTEVFLDPRGLQVVQNDVTPRSETNELASSLVESQLRVAQSEAVLRSVVQELHLASDPEFVRPPSFLSGLRAMLSTPGGGEDDETRALRELERAVSVRRESRSYVLVFTARTEDPLKSADIADAMAKLYIEREVNAREAAAERIETSMTSRLNELADRVRQSDSAVQTFKAKHNLIGSAARLMSDQQLEEMNSRLNVEHANVVQQRARMEQIDALLKSGADPDSSLEAVQSTTIANLRAQYAQLMRRYGAAEALLGKKHPELKVLNEQRAAYRRLITEELRRIAAAAKSEYERALASERALKGDLETLKHTTIQSNDAMVKLRELERVADSNRQIYEAFLVRAKEIGAQGRIDTSSARVIAEALPPVDPSSPRGMILVMALVLGLMSGVGWVALFGRRTRSA
ncbi:hypothetical protein APY04_0663 [Hyphomicrobium sulfonivorans]|uniref:Uncharacterized protein n=2 Tax=Hyphomicrobium sulfonivorans TaxID=121290 RepID=A0A109BLJ1_HYPSL|nr:hypothetical protein APY04_0663 [Hyphomicrobium sulfonivorans]